MVVFETRRLMVRTAQVSVADIGLFWSLWNCPCVMWYVGFPEGLGIKKSAVEHLIHEGLKDILTANLVVVRKSDSRSIGECKLGRPDTDLVSETDVKLLPAYQRQGYGTEVKQGLVDYLFTHTDCRVVRATPNRENAASQRMQERVGARQTGEGVYRFEKAMRVPTCDVPYVKYELTRED